MPDDWRTNPYVPSFASRASPPGPAGFWRRALAALIDLYVVSLLYLAFMALGVLGARLGAVQSGVEFLSDDLVRALAGPFLWLWWGLSWVYITVLTRNGGQTLGKMLLRIRVTQTNGADPSWTQAALRPAGYAMSWLPLGAGLLLAAVPPEKRALHDWILGTRVVTLRRASYAGRRIAAAWIVVAALSGPAWADSVSAPGVLVDRILATADDRMITLSDLIAYQTLVGPPNVSRDDAIRALIDRQLLLEEAERFAIADPPAAEIDSRIEAIVAESGGPAPFQERMAGLGWEQDALRAWVADDLRIAEFLDQRIYFFVLVSSQDIDAYYETHRAEFPERSLDEARDAINQRLVKERGDEKRDQFLARLHERATIRINPLP